MRAFPLFLVPCLALLLAVAAPAPRLDAAEEPANAPTLPLEEIQPGMKGEVWTVFQGTQPEPFTVEVTGIIRNAIGPGKDIILCRLTDPRVQDMGAVAGMSGSPLYINGRLAGALSYQLQRFETVHYAGFTPIADLLEVSRMPAGLPDDAAVPAPLQADDAAAPQATARPTEAVGSANLLRPLTPCFAFSGVDPAVAALFEPQLRALGLAVAVGGGSTSAAGGVQARAGALATGASPRAQAPLNLVAGDAVSVALATGDISIAGTGTVSRVDGSHLLAFGHPLMRMGAVDLPMVSTEVVGILPSQLSSMKVANIGAVIGTISQDRLSAVYGEVGRMPAMIPVSVSFPGREGTRTLRFEVVRQAELSPMITAVGVAQGVLGSNESGLSEGFRIRRQVTFPGGQTVSDDAVYPGPQGFAAGLGTFVRDLGAWLHNPYAKVFPSAVSFSIEPLDHDPQSILDTVRLSRERAEPGDTVQLILGWRDYRGAASAETLDIPVPRSWANKDLSVIVVNGPMLDELTGRPHAVPPSQIRSFDEYLAALKENRRTDGVYVAVVEKAAIFTDQTRSTVDYPASIERIARRADENRFQRREALIPLWERHILDGRIVPANVRRPLRIAE